MNSDASFRGRYKSGAGGNCLNCLMDNPGLVITNEAMKSVVLIANCRLLASVRESEDHKLGPSLNITSSAITVNHFAIFTLSVVYTECDWR